MAALAIPLVTQLLQGFLNQGQKNQIKTAQTQIADRQGQDYQLGRNQLFGTGNGTPGMISNIGDPSLQNITRQLQALYGGDQGGLFGQTQTGNQQLFDPQSLLQNLMGGQFDPYGQNTPGLQDALKNFSSLLPQLQGQSESASNIFQNGGVTPQSFDAGNFLKTMQEGGLAPQQQLNNMGNNIFSNNGGSALTDYFQKLATQGGNNANLDFAQKGAQDIFGNAGQTADTNSGIAAALQKLSGGGFTDALNGLSSTGLNVLNQNGLTPTGAQGEQAALKTINEGGATGTTNALQDIGVNLASQPSLMPIDKVLNMARDQAGTNYQNNMEGAIRQAQARGGGAGSTVANGLQNQGLADYSDKGAQSEAKAMQDALVQQQALQLKQQQQGSDTAVAGGSLENNRFGTASNALSNLEGIAANRFNAGGNFIQGANSGAAQNSQVGLNGLGNLAGLQSQRQMGALGEIPGIVNSGTNQANVFGNLGLGSNAQDLSRLGLGENMFTNLLNSQQGAGNSLNNLIGTQNQYGLGAGQLANSGSNDMASIIQQMLGGNFTASGQGLNRTNNYYNQANQGLNNNLNLMNFSGQQQQNSTNAYEGLIQQMFPWMAQQGNALNETQWASIPGSTNPWNSLIGSAGTALASKLGKKP